MKKDYETSTEKNKKLKEEEIYHVEKNYKNKVKVNENKYKLDIEELNEYYKEDIINIKDDFITNKYKAQIKLGETIYNAYNLHKGNIFNVKNMYNLMIIYYQNNDIFNKIVNAFLEKYYSKDADLLNKIIVKGVAFPQPEISIF